MADEELPLEELLAFVIRGAVRLSQSGSRSSRRRSPDERDCYDRRYTSRRSPSPERSIRERHRRQSRDRSRDRSRHRDRGRDNSRQRLHSRDCVVRRRSRSRDVHYRERLDRHSHRQRSPSPTGRAEEPIHESLLRILSAANVADAITTPSERQEKSSSTYSAVATGIVKDVAVAGSSMLQVKLQSTQHMETDVRGLGATARTRPSQSETSCRFGFPITIPSSNPWEDRQTANQNAETSGRRMEESSDVKVEAPTSRNQNRNRRINTCPSRTETSRRFSKAVPSSNSRVDRQAASPSAETSSRRKEESSEVKVEAHLTGRNRNRKCLIDTCSHTDRVLKPHFFKAHLPDNLNLTSSCAQQISALGHLASQLGFASLQEMADSALEGINADQLTINSALVQAMQGLCHALRLKRPSSTREFVTRRSPALLLHWRVLGSLINRLTRQQQIAFAKWKPGTSPASLDAQVRQQVPSARDQMQTFDAQRMQHVPSTKDQMQRFDAHRMQDVPSPRDQVQRFDAQRMQHVPPPRDQMQTFDAQRMQHVPPPRDQLQTFDAQRMQHVASPRDQMQTFDPQRMQHVPPPRDQMQTFDAQRMQHVASPRDQMQTFDPQRMQQVPSARDQMQTFDAQRMQQVPSPRDQMQTFDAQRMQQVPSARDRMQTLDARRMPQVPSARDQMQIFDAHFHLNTMFGRDARVSSMVEMKLSQVPDTPCVVNGGVVIFSDPLNYPRNVQESLDKPGFVAAVGLHPKHVSSLTLAQKEAFRVLMRNPIVKALGDIGLDYSAKDISKQETVLEYTLKGFADPTKPVILHLRGNRGNEDEVYLRALKLVLNCVSAEQPIHLHCFSGGPAVFAQWQQRFPNVYASYSGLVRSFTENQKRGLQGVPRNRLILETDAPYLPTMGSSNENTPHHIGDVARLVAAIRQEPIAQIVSMANANLCRLYGIWPF